LVGLVDRNFLAAGGKKKGCTKHASQRISLAILR
jgi:hypothetical protein